MSSYLCGNNTIIGKRWVQRLIKRRKNFRDKKEFKIDSILVNRATTDTIKAWFKKLELPEIKTVNPCNCWNINEASIMGSQDLMA